MTMLSQNPETNSLPAEDLNQIIAEYTHNQKLKIQTRKSLEDFLLFLSCQVFSASLALILFQYALSFWITAWLCQLIAWLPSLTSLGEVSFERSEGGWQIKIMQKPIPTIIKFVGSITLTSISIGTSYSQIRASEKAIEQTYQAIRFYSEPKPLDFIPHQTGFYLLVSLALIGILFIFQKPDS